MNDGSILLAEDDRVDTKAFLRALRQLGLSPPVNVARDGIEAWEALSRAGSTRPAMIVLDINMPRMNGLELLNLIRGERSLRGTPVFVLTTSDDEGDRYDAMALNVSGYIVKSGLMAGLQHALRVARLAPWPAPQAARPSA